MPGGGRYAEGSWRGIAGAFGRGGVARTIARLAALAALLPGSSVGLGGGQSQDPFVVKVGGGGGRWGGAPPPGPAPDAAGGNLEGECGEEWEACAGRFHPPNVAPRDPAAWRGSGWCGGGEEACPDRAVALWITRHNAVRRAAERGDVPPGSFLACKAMGGIGNFLVGLVSCLAVAMATNRSLLLAPPPRDPNGQRDKYAVPVGSLFDFPVDLDLGPIGVADVPVVTDEHNDEARTGLKLIDVRMDDLLCRNLTEAYAAPIAVLPAHLWLGAVPHNAHHAPFFTQHFGRDELGVSPVVSFLGPWLLRPKPRLLSLLCALAAAATTDGTGIALPVVGLQARLGLPGEDLPTEFPPPHSGPEYVRCALAHTPAAARGGRSAWVLVGDSLGAKEGMMRTVAGVEGPIVAAANEPALRALGLPPTYFAAGGVLGAARVAEELLDPALLSLGFAVAVFASGSRAVVLAAPPPDLASETAMEAALLEMWLLGYAGTLVVTENSTFWVPAVAFSRRGAARQRVFVFTRNKRCYPLPTREPVTDAGHRCREMTASPCYDDTLLNPTLTWLPYEAPR